MMYFCSHTGLPSAELRGASSRTGVGLPDLLEEQQAQLQLTCDCGACSIHQVSCSVVIKGNRNVPPLHRIDLVVCPSCGSKIPLLRPMVLHDQPRERVLLRLPESFRTRANGVLSWWFDWLQRSSRPVVPAYARQPVVEFVSPAARSNQQRSSSQPSMQAPAKRPPAGRQTQALAGSPLTASLASLSSMRPEPLASPPLTPAPRVEPPLTPAPRLEPPLTPKPPSIAEDEADKLLDSMNEAIQNKSAGMSDDPAAILDALLTSNLDPPGFPGSESDSATPTLTPSHPSLAELDPKGTLVRRGRRQGTSDFASALQDESFEDSYGELPINEVSGEFQEFEEPEDGPPTLMVSVPEPKKKPAARSTIALSSPPSVVVSGEELEPLHTDDDEGTLIGAKPPDVHAVAREKAARNASSLRPSLGGDPGVTREAPAPVLDDMVQEASSLAALASQELDILTTKPKEPFPEVPTVARRMAPQSLSEIRANQSRAATAIRNIVGNGVSSSPDYEKPAPPDADTLKLWKASKMPYHYGISMANQRPALHYKYPESSARLLDQEGELVFYIQLHRLPSYPLVVLLMCFNDSHGEVADMLACPLDVDDHNALIFLDMLMQDFCLNTYLADEDFAIYRDLQIQLPLEDNVEYLLEQARAWKNSISPSSQSFERAWKEFNTPGYDRLGKMEHNFNRGSFSDISTPAQAQLASGIVSYWSEPEQYDYLLTMKSFPTPHFRAIQQRTVEGCLNFGIYMPEHLRQLALDFELAESQQELLERLLSSFAETNLAIRQANNLDPWDNLTNWQKLLDTADEYHVEVDEDIEELAELAQRRCQSEGEHTHDIDDDDIVEIDAFEEMDVRELLEMLNQPAHRFEAALALCDTREPEYVDEVAGVFTNLERDDAITLAEAFTQFGSEAEPLLISWLHLPKPSHREAAMLALGTMGSMQAIDEIIKRLRSGEEWETAAEALGRIGEKALKALSHEIKNKNWLIRLRAVKALQKIKSQSTRPLFEQLRADPNEVVKAEVAAILNA